MAQLFWFTFVSDPAGATPKPLAYAVVTSLTTLTLRRLRGARNGRKRKVPEQVVLSEVDELARRVGSIIDRLPTSPAEDELRPLRADAEADGIAIATTPAELAEAIMKRFRSGDNLADLNGLAGETNRVGVAAVDAKRRKVSDCVKLAAKTPRLRLGTSRTTGGRVRRRCEWWDAEAVPFYA